MPQIWKITQKNPQLCPFTGLSCPIVVIPIQDENTDLFPVFNDYLSHNNQQLETVKVIVVICLSHW